MNRGPTLAFLSALAALLVLGGWALRPAEAPSPPTSRITLWTAGADAEPAVSPFSVHVALPDARSTPAGALRVNDTLELRRRLPHLTHVEIRGDGVDLRDAAALRGLAVSWSQSNRPALSPTLAAITAPPRVSVGQRVTVQGRIVGVGQAGARLTLQSPDGTLESLQLTAEAATTSVPFAISGSPTRAAGAFEWLLRLEPGGESVRLGVSVQSPPLPRVLLLQASPHPELSRLQRWLSAASSAVTSRTRVSTDRFRFSATPGSLAEFTSIDASVLQPFDLVIATEPALAELKPEEQQALTLAVRNAGIGLLVVGSVDTRAASSPLLPWRLEPTLSSGGDDRRLMRLQAPDGTEIAEWITLAASEIQRPALARSLVRDSQGRALAAAVRDGRGWLARTLLLDTWRWEQAGHAEAFSAYWAGLLSEIARPSRPETGLWRLASPDQPRLLHEPIDLIWTGPAENIPAAAQVSCGEPRVVLTLPVTHGADGSGTGHARYWPTTPGWHSVQSGGESAVLSFFVQTPDALPTLRAERRRAATAALVAASETTGVTAIGSNPNHAPLPRRFNWYPQIGYIAFATFVVAMTLLWLRERRG